EPAEPGHRLPDLVAGACRGFGDRAPLCESIGLRDEAIDAVAQHELLFGEFQVHADPRGERKKFRDTAFRLSGLPPAWPALRRRRSSARLYDKRPGRIARRHGQGGPGRKAPLEASQRGGADAIGGSESGQPPASASNSSTAPIALRARLSAKASCACSRVRSASSTSSRPAAPASKRTRASRAASA